MCVCMCVFRKGTALQSQWIIRWCGEYQSMVCQIEESDWSLLFVRCNCVRLWWQNHLGGLCHVEAHVPIVKLTITMAGVMKLRFGVSFPAPPHTRSCVLWLSLIYFPHTCPNLLHIQVNEATKESYQWGTWLVWKIPKMAAIPSSTKISTWACAEKLLELLILKIWGLLENM